MSEPKPPVNRTLVGRITYKAFRVVIIAIARLVWRARIRFDAPVPPRGPVILAPTHRSLLDIPLMAFVTPRPSEFMGKRELWKHRAVGAFISLLGAFPINRGDPDRAALARALDALNAEMPLVVFPEGTRCEGPTVGAIHDGIAYLAMKTGAPIVPIGVAGSEHPVRRSGMFPRFGRIAIVAGAPIPVERAARRLDRTAMAELTNSVATSLQSVFDRANAEIS